MQTDFRALQMAFAGHIRNPESAAPENIEDRRMAIYRRLIFNNIQNFCSNSFPVLKSLMAEDDWQLMVRDFMIQHRCQRPLFNEIAQEFIDYLENERDCNSDPPFIKELAHYEWVELALSIANAEFQQRSVAAETDLLTLSLKRSPLAWLLAYQFPVHQIGINNQPAEPSAQPNFLLVYRNADDQVKFIELNPVSARLLELLDEGLSGEQAAADIAKALQHPNADVVKNGARQMINDWLQRGIVV